MFARILPMTFGIGVYYIDLVVSRRFLSELGPGAQSYFSWAARLCDFPQGIFVMALATAALPSLSALAARSDRIELAKTWVHGLRLSLFVAVPCSVGLVVLGEPIVIALFERGEFSRAASIETARALVWQGGAIWTVAAVRQTVFAFHALGDTKSPVLVSAIDLAAFVALAFALRGAFGHVAISMAVAGSSFVQLVLLLVALRHRMGTLALRELGPPLAKTFGATSLAAVVGWALARELGRVSGIHRTVPGLVAVAAFSLAFVLAAAALRSPDWEEIAGALRRRLRRASMFREQQDGKKE